MGLLSLFGHNDEKAEVLCPYCEKSLADGHNQDKCAQRGMSRRSFFFMGIMGASSIALAKRLEGIPLTSARVQVIARWRDLIHVLNPQGPFVVAYDSAKRVRDVARVKQSPYPDALSLAMEKPGGLFSVPAERLEFHAGDSRRARVSYSVDEMQILAVTDKATGKPLDYEIVREPRVEFTQAAWRKQDKERREKEKRESAATERIRYKYGARARAAAGIVAPPGYERVFNAESGMFVDVPTEVLRAQKLLAKHPKHPTVLAIYHRAQYGGDKAQPLRLPA